MNRETLPLSPMDHTFRSSVSAIFTLNRQTARDGQVNRQAPIKTGKVVGGHNVWVSGVLRSYRLGCWF